MKVTPIRTRAVEVYSCKLMELLSESLTNIKPNSVIAITSKVVSLCEENVVPIKNGNKELYFKYFEPVLIFKIFIIKLFISYPCSWKAFVSINYEIWVMPVVVC